ncbi:MAG: hypothetical protein GF372_10495 [Candidatus Marinimicrobia bacterium]|nr:hypothetical protein [Candidatus Neomarinimicrobiota bacterium]
MKLLHMHLFICFLLSTAHSNELPSERILIIRHNNFKWISDVTTDSKGSIYVCDSRKKYIYIFDNRGYLVTELSGGGNIQFEIPYSINLDEQENIYILDVLLNRIFQFDSFGNIKQSFSYLPKISSNFEVSSDGRIWIYHHDRLDKDLDSTLIHEYDMEGNVKNTFGVKRTFPEYIDKKYIDAILEILPGDSLLVSHKYPYFFEVYHEHQLIFAFQKQEPFIEEYYLFENYGFQRKKQRALVWKVFSLNKNLFINVIRDEGVNYKSNSNVKNFDLYLDIFRVDGTWLKRFTWDWKNKGLPLHIDSEGYLYSNFSDKPSEQGVSKWRINWDLK